MFFIINFTLLIKCDKINMTPDGNIGKKKLSESHCFDSERGMKMRVRITSQGFPVITFSKMSQSDILYAELGSAIAKSPNLERRLLTASDLEKGKNPEDTEEPEKTMMGKMFADWSRTQTRKQIGEERAYALYTPKADEQKLTIRSCFPGTIMEWNCKERGDIFAVSDSFLVAEIKVKSKVYHTENASVKKFSGTNDVFQRFSGNGSVWLEVHGDLEEISLFPGESVQVCPGFFLAMSEDVKIEMVSAGDVHLRNRENRDYWIQLTAGERGGTVFCHSVDPRQFWAQHK